MSARRPPGRAERVLAWVDGWPERTGYAVGAAFGAAAGAALLWEPAAWRLVVFCAATAAAVPLAYLARVRQRVEAAPEPRAPGLEAPVTEGVVPWPAEPLAPLHPETPPPIRDVEPTPGGREPEPPPAPIMAPLPENLPEPRVAMVQIPAGDFWMGSAEDDPRASPNEKPRHHVRVEGFELGKYLITQAQYSSVMGYNPSDFKGHALPVTNVSWFAAIDFCNALSDRHGLRRAYERKGASIDWIHEADGYRLPTEAEWEYAARAGTDTAWSFEDDKSLLHEHAWFRANSDELLQPVGRKKPNSWGLFDVHGNVWEWCWDWYGAYPDPPVTGSERLLRGGSAIDSLIHLRSAQRFRYAPDRSAWVIGFRCARGPVRSPKEGAPPPTRALPAAAPIG